MLPLKALMEFCERGTQAQVIIRRFGGMTGIAINHHRLTMRISQSTMNHRWPDRLSDIGFEQGLELRLLRRNL